MRRTVSSSASPSSVEATLKPIELAVTTVLAFIAAILLISIGATMFGSGSVMSFGEDSVCTSSNVGTSAELGPGLSPGVQASALNVQLCRDHPDAGLRLLDTLHQLPAGVLVLTVLVSIEILVRRARRHGLFTVATARALRNTGWWLIAGPIVVTVLGSIAQARLVDDMYAEAGSSPFDYLSPDWALIITGIGVVTMARVLRAAVPMREELEATV